MLSTLPVFWQAVLFSAMALILVGGTGWWLFASPIRRAPPAPQAPPPRLAMALAVLLGISALQLTVGGLWDASQHLTTGEIPGGSDFLWPSHLVIYSSFLLSLAGAMVAIALLALPAWRAGMRDPRLWVRRSSHLAAVALASFYQLMAIPGDALWHKLFGIDLTAWSPPHLSLALMGAVVLLSAAAMVVRARPAMARPVWADAAIVTLLALMLNVAYMVGVLEWELPGQRSPLVAARPLWAYPVVAGTLAFLTLQLARELVHRRWAATAVAAIFFFIRGGISAALGLTGNIAPASPLVFLIGALLLDVVPWRRWFSRTPLATDALEPLTYSAGFAAGAIPVLAGGSFVPTLGAADVLTATGLTFALGVALTALARWLGGRLRGV